MPTLVRAQKRGERQRRKEQEGRQLSRQSKKEADQARRDAEELELDQSALSGFILTQNLRWVIRRREDQELDRLIEEEEIQAEVRRIDQAFADLASKKVVLLEAVQGEPNLPPTELEELQQTAYDLVHQSVDLVGDMLKLFGRRFGIEERK